MTDLSYHVRSMKIIKITDTAFERLLEWKHKDKETFSQVILKFVPKRGTAIDLLNTMSQMPSLDDAVHQKMIEAYEDYRR